MRMRHTLGPLAGLAVTLAMALAASLPASALAALQCAESDRLGNRSEARMETGRGGTIQSFHWTMKTPSGDRCEFDSAEFAYAPRGSAVEFDSARGCRLFIWTQANGVTLAPSSCEAHCTAPQAHDYLWPIIFDRSGRGCGRPR